MMHTWYGHAKYHGIVHECKWAFAEIERACSTNTFGTVCDCEVENPANFYYGQPHRK